jgi:membrane protein DedA with SNARE-associated domain
MVPFLLAAGAAQYPRKKFLAALALGRLLRFTILAFLAAAYGSRILQVISQHGRVALYVVIGVCVAVGAFFVIRVLKRKAPKHA